MHGDLDTDCIAIGGVHLLESARHTAMQECALRRANLGVRDLADLVVGEVVRVGSVFVHDLPLPQFVEWLRQAVDLART